MLCKVSLRFPRFHKPLLVLHLFGLDITPSASLRVTVTDCLIAIIYRIGVAHNWSFSSLNVEPAFILECCYILVSCMQFCVVD